MTNHHKTVSCKVCGKKLPLREAMPADCIHGPVLSLIQAAVPGWDAGSYICLPDLNRFRSNYIEAALAEEKGDLTRLEESVLRSLAEQETLSRNINTMFERQLTFGERLADKVAEFGGSWYFIILFFCVLAGWIAVNSIGLLSNPYDPYPFILLNLVLSCLAAIQAPIIMMSQNRQEAKDRLRAENDFKVNLKAELEIRHLHSKMDLLMTHQWQRLLEIQNIQTDMMRELLAVSEKRKSADN